MKISSFRLGLACTALSIALAAPLSAQAARSAPASTPKSIAGVWAGTATVQLPDTTITVPVFYTFVDGPGGISGSATVPGQGTGPVSNVVRDGASIRFRVTAKQTTSEGVREALLDHDGKVGADGAIEGMVNLNAKPVAKFRIKPNAPPAKK